MTLWDDLAQQVEDRYAALALPSWPAPRSWGEQPREEEYSRLTDPGRYRIVHARAEVWADVLGRLPGVTTTRSGTAGTAGTAGVEGVEGDGRRPPALATIRLAPDRPGALPLLLVLRQVPPSGADAALPVLDVCAVRADFLVAMEPGCGCDACDDGSAAHLHAVDDAVRRVVASPIVLLRGPRWSFDWSPDAWAGSDLGRGPGADATVDLCRRLAAGERVRLPRGTEAVVGRPWFGP